MVIKRKAVSKFVSKYVEKRPDTEVQEQEEEAAAATVVLKRPAAATGTSMNATVVLKRPAAATDTCMDAAPMEDVDEKEDIGDKEDKNEEISEEQKVREQEEREAARRTKDLKGTPVAELKELMAGLGLEVGSKADMIQQVVAHEAKVRVEAREHEAKLRAVVVNKKGELEALPLPELRNLCAACGIKGMLSKQDRIQQLLKKWQDEDGVDKAMRQMARDARRTCLEMMDKLALRDMCQQLSLDPFVTEIIVDRISSREHEIGCYLRLAPSQEEQAKQGAGTDIVDALLESEKTRKMEKELQRQQEEAAANKRKELRAMTIDELKKALAKQGVEAAGKKEDMVERLYEICQQEEAVAARKSELKALSIEELKDQVKHKGLEVAGGKEKFVEALLAHEAKLREELHAFDAKAAAVLARKKEELEKNTSAELKELCETKGLKVGGGKEEKVERLLEEAQKSGEIHDAVAADTRRARREALLVFERADLVALCEKLGLDPLVKEVMVERILMHEAECGATETDAAAPAAKKARTSKK